MNDVAHSASALCPVPAPRAFAHLTSAAGMARWCLGMTGCKEVSPGLMLGRSLFDGSPAYVRVEADAQRLSVEYLCGSTPETLVPRIHARVVPGPVLGHREDQCVATLLAWRPAGMNNARWQRLMASHEAEILLVQEQLAASESGRDLPLPLDSAADPVNGAPASTAGGRRFFSSGSPWEALAGYSRAVADGRWVFVSGTVGAEPRTGRLAEGARAQAEQAIEVIEKALAQAGASLSDVVRVRAYVPDPVDVVAVSEVVKQRLGPARATNTTVCAPLAVAGAKVEIEVTALKPG